jgi:hypothetical protein
VPSIIVALNAMSFQFTEIEDRILAMAEGEWIDLSTASDILSSWFERQFSDSELKNFLRHLCELDLIKMRVKVIRAANAQDDPLTYVPNAIEFTATDAGLGYLNEAANDSI